MRALGLADLDRVPDDGVQHLNARLVQLVNDLARVPCAAILCHQRAHHLEVRVVVHLHLLNLVHDLPHAIAGPLIAVYRDDHPVRSRQRVDAAHVQIRRAVHQAVVVFALHRLQTVPQVELPRAGILNHLAVCLEHPHVAGEKGNRRDRRLHNGVPHHGHAQQNRRHAGPVVVGHAEELAGVALLVQINHQNALALGGQLGGQVASGDGFPDAAFQVDNCNAYHSNPPVPPGRRVLLRPVHLVDFFKILFRGGLPLMVLGLPSH